MREQRGGVWTPWSAAYTFTIIAPPPPLEITAFCNRSDRATAAACQAGGADGLDPEESWYIWVRGVEDWANVYYSIDGGLGALRRDTSLAGLAPGPHTVHIRELRSGVWTDWSAPYTFTIRAAPTIMAPTTFAICNMWWDQAAQAWQRPDTAADCLAAGATGLRTGRDWDWTWWGTFENLANLEYRFDGGVAFRFGSAEDRAAFEALAPGQHTIQVREQHPAGVEPLVGGVLLHDPRGGRVRHARPAGRDSGDDRGAQRGRGTRNQHSVDSAAQWVVLADRLRRRDVPSQASIMHRHSHWLWRPGRAVDERPVRTASRSNVPSLRVDGPLGACARLHHHLLE